MKVFIAAFCLKPGSRDNHDFLGRKKAAVFDDCCTAARIHASHFPYPCYLTPMNLRDLRAKGTGKGFLNDHFLAAMPGMGDPRFARAVIYICAHSDDGAMGFIINQSQPVVFKDILLQLGVAREDEIIRLPEAARGIAVRNGGPVDKSRGFVIHSDDFMVGSTMPAAGTAGRRDRRERLADLPGHGEHPVQQ
jgi:Uncharacterized ACR, COG1678